LPFRTLVFEFLAKNKPTTYGLGSLGARLTFVLGSVEQRQKPWTICSLLFFIWTVVASKQQKE